MLIDPFRPTTHRKLAEVLQRMGDTSAALEEYETLCKLQPDRAQNFADAAFAYHKLGDTENARRFAQQAVDLDSASPARTLLDSSTP